MHVQSCCFERFFTSFFELEHERTLFGLFYVQVHVRRAPFLKANLSRENPFLMRFFFTIGFLIPQITILKRILGGFLIKISSYENG